MVSGSIWFLQGINVLPGSFITGQIRWAVYGGIAPQQESLYCWLPTGDGGTVEVG